MSPYKSEVDLEQLGESQLIMELRQLYLDRGEPSMRSLAEKTGFSASTVHAALREDRLPSPAVVKELVQALGGDTERFLKLHELARAGQLGLGDRAERIAQELKVLPLGAQVVDRRGETTQHIYHGDVYYGVTATNPRAQPLPPARRPLEESLPPYFREVYESIGISFSGGLYTVVGALSFWLIEAVVRENARFEDRIDIEPGLESMARRDLIDERLVRWGTAAARRRAEIEHLETQSYQQQDAEYLFDFVTALCSSVYLVNRGFGRDF
ncbi:helix-turn-helix domain-containing protein [Micromonospora sp. NPDC047740]|uniref:helix-turn-helix domain-containing protein n=1 Tax=Micromonospora sp. NPDC047740 TaxID=3364254 RepID=UPI003723F519